MVWPPAGNVQHNTSLTEGHPTDQRQRCHYYFQEQIISSVTILLGLPITFLQWQFPWKLNIEGAIIYFSSF